MKNDVERIAFLPISLRDLEYSFGISNIRLMNIISLMDDKSFNWWELLVFPEDLRKKCWAYRLNSYKEFQILREKVCREFNWKNTKGCYNSKFNYFILN